MNRIIISSNLLLTTLQFVRVNASSECIKLQAKDGKISFGKIVNVDCHLENDFVIRLYISTVRSLINILLFISDQPLTITFKESENFPVQIDGIIV